jgi:hypothetical protein
MALNVNALVNEQMRMQNVVCLKIKQKDSSFANMLTSKSLHSWAQEQSIDLKIAGIFFFVPQLSH